MIYKFAKHHHAPDPKDVNSSSPVLVMKFLATYCKTSSKNALGDDSMGAVIQ